MPRPVHFDITATDPKRLVSFYSDIFGWQFNKWEGPFEYWLIKTGSDNPGIDGGLGKRNGGSAGTQNTIGVDDLDKYVAKVTASGGNLVTAKRAIPGVGWYAECSDPDGNEFGLMQPDSNAK